MTICHVHASGTIELYFYGELDAAARVRVQQHVDGCAECRQALDDMRTIRIALANRPDVSTPPGGEWTGFMARLEHAIDRERSPASPSRAGSIVPRQHVAYAAMAALLALVTISVGYVLRERRQSDSANMRVESTLPVAPPDAPAPVAPSTWSVDHAFASLSEQHFERSKLVVFGLANKDPRHAGPEDWAYERQLASSLLSDTRLYRQAAEERGLKSVARVMGDLELVLLQAALTSDPEPATLQQIQNLIRKRNLVTKMEVVAAGF